MSTQELYYPLILQNPTGMAKASQSQNKQYPKSEIQIKGDLSFQEVDLSLEQLDDNSVFQLDIDMPVNQSVRSNNQKHYKIDQAQIIRRLELAIRQKFPEFCIQNYLSNKNATQYKQSILNSKNTNQELKFSKRSVSVKQNYSPVKIIKEYPLECKSPKIVLPRLLEKKFTQNLDLKQIIKQQMIDSQVDHTMLPNLEKNLEQQSVSLNQLYKDMFNYQDGRIVMKQHIDKHQKDIRSKSSVEKAQTILKQYYFSRNTQQNIKHEAQESEVEQQSYKSPPPVVISRLRENYKSFDANQLMKNLMKQIQKANDNQNSSMNQFALPTEKQVDKNQFELLNVRSNKRENQYNDDIGNYLALVHDDQFLEKLDKDLQKK